MVNTLNGQSGALGNASGITFNLALSAPTMTWSIDTGTLVINANGSSNTLQINRPPIGAYSGGAVPTPLDITNEFGGTGFAPSSGTNATAALTFLNPYITSCDALKFNLLHEIAHTLGLDDCDEYNPAADESVMYRPVSLNPGGGFTPADFNFVPSNALTGLSDCDNQKIKSTGSYNTPLNGGGGEPPGGGGGGVYYCTPYYWVYYESWDGGETWYVVDYWYAGCW